MSSATSCRRTILRATAYTRRWYLRTSSPNAPRSPFLARARSAASAGSLTAGESLAEVRVAMGITRSPGREFPGTARAAPGEVRRVLLDHPNDHAAILRPILASLVVHYRLGRTVRDHRDPRERDPVGHGEIVANGHRPFFAELGVVVLRAR